MNVYFTYFTLLYYFWLLFHKSVLLQLQQLRCYDSAMVSALNILSLKCINCGQLLTLILSWQTMHLLILSQD